MAEGDAAKGLSYAIEAWRGYKSIKRKKPERLCNYLIRMGGIKDQGGSVSFLTGGPRGRPGLISRSGLALDDAALLAWEAGYFTNAIERPTINDFLDLIDKDLTSDGVFRHDDNHAASELALKAELAREIEEAGIADAKSVRQVIERLNGKEEEKDVCGGNEIPF